MRLGDVVHVRNHPKGADCAFVVVAMHMTSAMAKVSYCGAKRWFVPQWVRVQDVDPATDNPHTRRARRWLDEAGYDADGWKRIDVGRYGASTRVSVNHETMVEP